MALTLGLWRVSITLLNFNLRDDSDQASRQTIDRIRAGLDEQLMALRHVSRFYANSDNIQENEFQSFATALLLEYPGILAVMITDRDGHPMWLSRGRGISLNDAYVLTGDPKLKSALAYAMTMRTPSMGVTEPLDLPQHGEGFLAATPIFIGQHHAGFVVGLFPYQMLFDMQSMLHHRLSPELLARVSVQQSGRTVYRGMLAPAPGVGPARPPVESRYMLGNQNWVISILPPPIAGGSPTRFASITILGMGLLLAGLLSWQVFRWQWRAVVLQSEAHDQRKRLERTGLSLAEVKSEMDLILNSVDEGVVFYSEQLEPIQANAAFLTTFGLTDNGHGMQSGTAHHEYMIQWLGSESKYWSLFNVLRDNPEQSYTDQIEIPRNIGARNGGRVFLRNATTLCGADGERRGVLVIYKDLTTIKAIDRVKEEFLSNVTHELRSPLASIKGFAETMRRDQAMPVETRQEFTSIICEEATRLQELIDELLDLRRMEAQGMDFNPLPYDFRLLVEEVVRGSKSILLSKNIMVRMQWDGPASSRLKGDVAQISRALRNLMVNAVKYSPQGGEIQILGHCGPQMVWLEITDQGSGIEDKDLPHIFEKFYRGTRQVRHKGTGLGLAIVKHIVERHGGHLGVRSEPGSGTTFRVELPRQYMPSPVGLETPIELEPLDQADAAGASESGKSEDSEAVLLTHGE